MNIAEGGRRGAVAQHDERRGKTTRATRFRRVALVVLHRDLRQQGSESLASNRPAPSARSLTRLGENFFIFPLAGDSEI